MNIIRIAKIWSLGFAALLLVTALVVAPLQLLMEDTPTSSLLQELVGLLVWLGTAHFAVRRAAGSPSPLAWKSLAVFIAGSAVLMTWSAFGAALLTPPLAPEAVTVALVVLLLAAVVVGWFCFSLAMKLVKEIAAAVMQSSIPKSLLATAANAGASPTAARQD